uniref:Uncharacterized protein n=1 Tax=Tanacetum cinerariifolium TaxID=118510 RepID=A0A6L2KE78_TANCI|nr:hypothetical protein [Tanacetum cinerariifolium]
MSMIAEQAFFILKVHKDMLPDNAINIYSMFKLRKLQIERGKPSLGSHGNSLSGTKNIPHAAITAKAFCPRWQQSSPLDSIFDSRKGIQSVAVMTEVVDGNIHQYFPTKIRSLPTPHYS